MHAPLFYFAIVVTWEACCSQLRWHEGAGPQHPGVVVAGLRRGRQQGRAAIPQHACRDQPSAGALQGAPLDAAAPVCVCGGRGGGARCTALTADGLCIARCHGRWGPRKCRPGSTSPRQWRSSRTHSGACSRCVPSAHTRTHSAQRAVCSSTAGSRGARTTPCGRVLTSCTRRAADIPGRGRVDWRQARRVRQDGRHAASVQGEHEAAAPQG